jgi:tetratricopeptide (TPR) repeat protein
MILIIRACRRGKLQSGWIMGKFGLWLLASCWIIRGLTAAENDPLLKAARSQQTTGKVLETVNLLEDALLKNPQQEQYWVELLELLRHSAGHACGSPARYYYQEAQRHFPKSLALRWVWLRCLSPEAALDELVELERLEPNKDRIRDARELLTYRLAIPHDWNDPRAYYGWAMVLLHAQKIERAATVMKRGLELNPKDCQLKKLKALMLAIEGKYDQALEANKQAGYLQLTLWGGNPIFPSLGDLLLKEKRYQDVVASFGTKRDRLFAHERLILGQAHLMLNEPDKAEAVLEKADRNVSAMLMIALMLEQNLEKEATELAEDVMDKWPEPHWRNAPMERDMKYRSNWPMSLEPYLRRSLTWLWKNYPDRRKYIGFYLATPETLFSIPSYIKETIPCGVDIELSLAAMAQNPGDMDPNARYGELSLLLAYEHQHNEAAALELCAKRMKAAKERGLCSTIYMEHWSRDQREVQAQHYFVGRFAELVAARRLVANLVMHGKKEFFHQIAHQEWYTPDEVVEQLSKQHPAALALLYPHIGTYMDVTNVLALRVFAEAGSTTDMPLLVMAFWNDFAKQQQEQDEKKRERMKPYYEQLVATLDKLCKLPSPPGSVIKKNNYFIAWWHEFDEAVFDMADKELQSIQEGKAAEGKAAGK